MLNKNELVKIPKRNKSNLCSVVNNLKKIEISVIKALLLVVNVPPLLVGKSGGHFLIDRLKTVLCNGYKSYHITLSVFLRERNREQRQPGNRKHRLLPQGAYRYSERLKNGRVQGLR